MRRFKGKRGAIELSMNTIIIVVIGITILTLGLRWIYGIFDDLSDRSAQIGKLSDEQIRGLFEEQDDVIYIETSTPEVKKGKEINLNAVVKNIYSETHKFRYVVEAQEKADQSAVKWYKKEFTLASGEGWNDFITFNSKMLSLGSHNFRVIATCLDCSPVEEKSEPLILGVNP